MSSQSQSQSRQYWEPPGPYDWGEGTVQARKQRDDEDEEPAPKWWTDAYEIRMASKLFREVPGPFDPGAYEYELYPDTLIHEKPPDEWSSEGGTDWAAVGDRGSGKTTHNRHWALRLMEMNPEEIVVWRGDPSRSGWSDLREWATVWLPANASYEALWKSEEKGVPAEDADLEDEVRQVRRYDDPVDLLDQLGDEPGGTLHVVYPDPSFTGCQELTRRTYRVGEALPFTPRWATIGDESPTPLPHWWFAFLLAAVEFRESMYWLSLIFDEARDLAPDSAEEDDHRTWKKVDLLQSIYESSRKYRVSLYWSYHFESKMHEKFRKEVERRISMPDGSSNPTRGSTRSHPLGFDSVPMIADLMSDADTGTALMYEGGKNGLWNLYSWKDLSRKGEDNRWLRIELDEPERDEEAEEDEGPTLEYDTSIFKRWSAGDEDRLYVRDPGAGYIDTYTGAEVEPLESPKADHRFGGIRELDEELVVTMLPQDGDGEIVVAR
ncbi:MAG: hypothetical protein ABEI98_01535, partial [Halorhabdus sp.]